jgi:hypothetical protein
MKKFNGVNITQRARRRKRKNGAVVAHDQWFANFNDPKTGKRRIIAFDRKKDAEAYKVALLINVDENSYVDESKAPTVAQAIDHWFATKEGAVKPSTLKGYKVVANGAIRGPLLIGTKQERANYTEKGIVPKNARFLKMLGHI